MKFINLFFKKRKKTYLHELLKILNIKDKKNYKNILINDIKNLDNAISNDISFFHTVKYKVLLNSTKLERLLNIYFVVNIVSIFSVD